MRFPGAPLSIFNHDTESELSSEARRNAAALAAADPERQRKRMLIALGFLLVALAAVLVKDWDFWFPPNEETESTTTSAKKKAGAASVPAKHASPTSARDHKRSKAAATAAAEIPMTATTERAALPPLAVEVVAGNRHTMVHAKSDAIRVNVGSEGEAPPDSPPVTVQEGVVSAGDRVQLSPQAQQTVSRTVPPDYPLLARQMKVQGAVVLQALISREGTIQGLEIVSGPGILASAAREAVKQWRFKPFYQHGNPVETSARITVNFTISTN
jgi:TonB family protein